jgi:Tfp pilus assembly protein PilO
MFVSSMDGPAIVMITLLVMTACTIILWPLMRALGRRLEGRGSVDAALRSEMEQMQHRLADVDTLQMRVGELEERLDFAERLLAKAREPDRLQR